MLHVKAVVFTERDAQVLIVLFNRATGRNNLWMSPIIPPKSATEKHPSSDPPPEALPALRTSSLRSSLLRRTGSVLRKAGGGWTERIVDKSKKLTAFSYWLFLSPFCINYGRSRAGSWLTSTMCVIQNIYRRLHRRISTMKELLIFLLLSRYGFYFRRIFFQNLEYQPDSSALVRWTRKQTLLNNILRLSNRGTETFSIYLCLAIKRVSDRYYYCCYHYFSATQWAFLIPLLLW